jgi:hypothetical protein
VLAGAGLAVAGAAAALLVLLAGDDPEQSVDVGPAGTTTTVFEVPTPPVAVAPGFPTHPLAVVVEVDGAHRLDVYDAESGQRVATGIARSVHSISDVSVMPDGTVFFTEELGDSSVVRAVPWDGSAEPMTPYGADENDSASPTMSPDGRRFAFISQGITVAQPAVVVIDVADGDRTSVVVSAAGARLSNLEFSPGGERLVVLVDGVPWVVDVPVDAPVSGEASMLGSEPVLEVHWSAGDEVLTLTRCCAPSFDGPAQLDSLTVDGPGSFTAVPAEDTAAFDVDARLTYAFVLDDGTVALYGGGLGVRPLEVDGAAVDLGY